MRSREPISVIIPHYETPHTLVRAIESILNQTVLPTEIIVIDDASSPESQRAAKAIVTSIETVDSRFEVLGTNSGPGAARNAGWDLARQPVIAFLDADDSWLPQKVELQAPLLLTGAQFDVVGHQRFVLASSNTVPRPGVFQSEPGVLKLRRNQWLWHNHFSTPTVMLQRELPFRFLADGRHSEDYDLWLRIAFSGRSMAFLQAPLAVVHKAKFGAPGLSGDLWAMERGELRGFRSILNSEEISASKYGAAVAFSLARYLLRVLKVRARRLPLP